MIHHTDFGTVIVASPEAHFAELARLATAAWREAPRGRFSWALTGGSTPKAWYRWCVERRALAPELMESTQWFVGDERCVPLESAESNFGNAARLLLDPARVPVGRRHPWRVDLAPAEAVRQFAAESEVVCGAVRCFSLCVLGLGDDAHTASLFPGSPLLSAASVGLWAAVDVPGKGWRLTITPAGLAACDRIVVHATGRAKAEAVRRVFAGDEAVVAVPAKLLAAVAGKTTWLLDPESVSECPDFVRR